MNKNMSLLGIGVGLSVAAAAAWFFYRFVLKPGQESAVAPVSSSATPDAGGKLPATVRNNNPGAIMNVSTGKIMTYDSVDSGVEAMMKLLKSYVDRGYNTITKIISRWAPSAAGNATSSYISFVSSRSGIPQDTVINASNRLDYLSRIAYQMHIMEAGYSWIDVTVFRRIGSMIM